MSKRRDISNADVTTVIIRVLLMVGEVINKPIPVEGHFSFQEACFPRFAFACPSPLLLGHSVPLFYWAEAEILFPKGMGKVYSPVIRLHLAMPSWFREEGNDPRDKGQY